MLCRMQERWPIALTLALLLGSRAARAEEALADVAAPRQGLELNLGAGPLLYPAYPGARTYRVLPFPYIGGGYGNWAEFELLDALRVTALSIGGFSVGPAARLRFGRSTSNDRAQLTGLRSFPDTVELGGFVGYEAGPLWLDATATQGIARAHGGAAMDARALLSIPVGKVGLEIGPELRVATRSFMQAYFGIDESRAAAAGRAAYSAGGGLERAGLLANAELRLTNRLSLRSFVEYGRLLGSAASSPLTRQGGALDQVYAGAFLTWRLN